MIHLVKEIRKQLKSVTMESDSKDDQGGDISKSLPSKDRQDRYKVSQNVWQGRIVFVLTLFAVALVFGLLAFFMWRNEERKLAERQFESIVERALLSAKAFFLRRRQVVVSVASLAEELHPNASQGWPFVTIPGFPTVARNIMETSSPTGSLSFLPLVLPEQLTEFEDFAYDYYERDGYPNGTAIDNTPNFPIRPFGRGVSSASLYPNGTFYFTRETQGRTAFNSSHRVLTPVLQYAGPTRPGSASLLLNLHSIQLHGEVIDTVIDCAAEKSSDQDKIDDDAKNGEAFTTQCTGVSHVNRLQLPEFGSEREREQIARAGTTTLVHGIFPKNNPTTVCLQNDPRIREKANAHNQVIVISPFSFNS